MSEMINQFLKFELVAIFKTVIIQLAFISNISRGVVTAFLHADCFEMLSKHRRYFLMSFTAEDTHT